MERGRADGPAPNRIDRMAHPKIYILFPGDARHALGFYHSVFGGQLALSTYSQFGRRDGPGDAIAHGVLTGEIALYGADAGADERAVRTEGLMLSILGANPARSRTWFERLAEGGTVLDPLRQRAWGDWDGQVRDRYGLRWLIGFKEDQHTGSHPT